MLLVLFSCGPEATNAASEDSAAKAEPTIIAHRGASGYLPEHTLAAYAVAHAQGADYVEPDLVLTRDGQLICLHDIHLEGTTNVEAVFPARARDDGRFYAADFTLEEIRTLSAVERLDGRFPRGDSRFGVPTFGEMVELVRGLNRSTGRVAGVYPELKAGAWHDEAGLDIEKRFAEVVGELAGLGTEVPIYVQSFEPASLEELVRRGVQFPLVQLVSESQRELLTAGGLAKIARYADGVGPSKTLIEEDPEIVRRAHQQGLVVHPYTFRADSVGESHSTFADEVRVFVRDYEVDGFFTDFPDRAREALESGD